MANFHSKPHSGIWAAKAVIFFERKLLLQLRDTSDEIFYPNHWGLFGGEVEAVEESIGAVKRELTEELSLTECTPIPLFTWMSPENGATLDFFFVESGSAFDSLRLNEGQKMDLFRFEELEGLQLTPDIKANLAKLECCFKRFVRLGSSMSNRCRQS